MCRRQHHKVPITLFMCVVADVDVSSDSCICGEIRWDCVVSVLVSYAFIPAACPQHSTEEGQPLWRWTQHWPPKSASCKDSTAAVRLLSHFTRPTPPNPPLCRKGSSGGPYPSSCCAPSIPSLTPNSPQIIKVPIGRRAEAEGESVIEALTGGVEWAPLWPERGMSHKLHF